MEMSFNITEEFRSAENVTQATNSKTNPVRWHDIGLHLLFITVGGLGNGLVIWIVGFRMKRTSFLKYILNLAVADFGFCIHMSTSIPTILAGGHYVFGVWICRIDYYIGRVFFYAGTLLIACISLERCLAIQHPIWYKCRRPRWFSTLTYTGAWVVALAIPIAIPLEMDIFEHPGNLRQCAVKSEKASRALSITELFVVFLLPLCVIVTSNVIIFKKMMKDHQERDKQNQVNRTVFITTALFLLCWTPFQVTQVILVMQWQFFTVNGSLSTFVLNLIFYFSYLMYLNSCLNPFIYLLMGSEMKKRVMVSMPCLQVGLERAFRESTTEKTQSISNSLSA